VSTQQGIFRRFQFFNYGQLSESSIEGRICRKLQLGRGHGMLGGEAIAGLYMPLKRPLIFAFLNLQHTSRLTTVSYHRVLAYLLPNQEKRSFAHPFLLS
jgi:hypothetical protein